MVGPRCAPRLALAFALGAAGCDPKDPADELDLLDAIAIAQDEVPDALTLDAERTVEGGVFEYDIDRWLDGETHEVLIDAHGNAHTAVDPDDVDEAAAEAAVLMAHEVSLLDAIEIALAEVAGTVVVAELDVERAAMQVGIEDGDDFTLVVVDLATAEIIEIRDSPIDDD